MVGCVGAAAPHTLFFYVCLVQWPNPMANREKILVLMSGGVDSSTAAALLKREGYEVSGVYLKLYETRNDTNESGLQLDTNRHETLGDPCWASEMRDAARVAAHLGIPFQVWDVTQEYKKRVLENFYGEYAAGRTPNPDVLCNSEIKFGVALERALAAGFEYVATGHYGRVFPRVIARSNATKQSHGEEIATLPTVARNDNCLYTAVDKNKDQSYFLWRLTQEQLAHVTFPIGEYTKPQVRALAQEFGLHNWNKKDSQGVCFLGKIELKEFLYKAELCTTAQSSALKRQSGPILNVHGNLLGFHDGLAHFTIGQRHGTKLGGTGPYYVVEKDVASNTLIVANEKDEPNYRAVECTVREAQLHVTGYTLQVTRSCMARTRYRAPLCRITYYHTSEYASMGRVIFDEPQRAVAPGQSIVFYDGDRVVGGGIIDHVELNSKLQISNHKETTNYNIQIPLVCNL